MVREGRGGMDICFGGSFGCFVSISVLFYSTSTQSSDNGSSGSSHLSFYPHLRLRLHRYRMIVY